MESKGQKTLFSEQPQLCLGKRAERWGRAAWSLPPENPVKPDVVACVCGGGARRLACLLACLRVRSRTGVSRAAPRSYHKLRLGLGRGQLQGKKIQNYPRSQSEVLRAPSFTGGLVGEKKKAENGCL